MNANLEVTSWRPTRERITWLAISLSLVLIPHALRMPGWVTVSFAVLTLWRVEHVIHGVRLPNRWYRLLLSIAIVIGVLVSYGTLFGREAGIAALAVLAGMKLLETDTLRDAFSAAFLGYFLVITNFLYSQTIVTGVYMLLVVIVMTATLIAISGHEGSFEIRRNLRYATSMLAQALPLMLVLFLLFPRIPGPLWGLPKDARGATSGLSESMSPGAISQLGLSTSVAFRVEFDGAVPEPSTLYWRGPVFWNTDGRTWSSGEHRLNRQLPDLEPRGTPVYYTITLEAHDQHWIFALDVPGTVQREMRISDEYQLFSTRRLRDRARFRLRSYPDGMMKRMTPEQRHAALELPSRAHPRARELAALWRDEVDTDAQLVDKALRYFRSQPFFYTLKPPLLLNDPVDEFLFESRRGFCEHYASSFTVLMRAAGIPARVVTGYQGGEVNPLGDYVIVRQRDAHAWSEVWLDNQGWTRVDPTAAVSPQRIEQGMDATIPNPIGPEVFNFAPSGRVAQIFRHLRHGWDTVNNSWNQWVLGYGPARQRTLLQKLGLDASNWRNLLVTILGAIAIVLGAVAFWLIRNAPSPDPVVKIYQTFCAKLARAGISRRPHEGPHDFAHRVGNRFPDISETVEAVTRLYVGIRYAESNHDLKQFDKAVSTFRPRPVATRSRLGGLLYWENR